MKIVNLVGARPQFIKAAMVSRALQPDCQEILLHTGQHYDENMSKVFFEELGLPDPAAYLGVGSDTHARQTARMLIGIEEFLLQEKPDWLVVYGDTNSTLAGALAAVKIHIPVAHVEAGLRSYQKTMPEEINRLLVDHVSSRLFCPSQLAADNLAKEGVSQGVYVVGDVMVDALQYFLEIASARVTILADLGLTPGSYALATIHRAANTDDPYRLAAILEALGELELPVVFPVHPRTREVIERRAFPLGGNIRLIAPVSYLSMLQLEASADCILTDSGGVQKEAYWLGVRCITLREETEWVEIVALGWNRLVGIDRLAIIDAVHNWRPSQDRPPIYGDGHAAERIKEILITGNPASGNLS
jgi:UDP-GlcNAc3NAcA epimerase